MAFEADQTDQTGQTDINAPKAIGTTGAGGVGTATTTGGGTSKEAPGGYGGVAPGSQSGSFQNVGAILNANKNSNIAGGIVNNYNQQAGQFNQAVGQQQQGADQSINNQWNTATGGQGGTEQQAQGNVQNIIQNAGNSSAGWNATGQNQNAVNQFQAALNTQYQAPATDWTQAQSQAQNFQQAAQNTQSAAGQTALLQQQYGSPSYTQGQQQIDQLLLQNNRPEQNQLKQLQQLGGQTTNTLANAQQNVNSTGQAVQNNISQLNAAAQNALGSAIGSQGTIGIGPASGTLGSTGYTPAAVTGTAGGGLLGTLATQAANTGAASQNNYNNASQDIASGQYNPALLQAMGVQGGQSSYGLGPSQIAAFLQQAQASQNTPTLSGVLSGQQAAQANALESLAGNNALGATLSSALGQSGSPAVAGTTTAYTPTFGTSAGGQTLQGALANAQSGLNTGVSPILGALETANNAYLNQNIGSGYINAPNFESDLSAAQSSPTNVAALTALAGAIPNFNYEPGNQLINGGTEQSALQALLGQYGGTFGTAGGLPTAGAGASGGQTNTGTGLSVI